MEVEIRFRSPTRSDSLPSEGVWTASSLVFDSFNVLFFFFYSIPFSCLEIWISPSPPPFFFPLGKQLWLKPRLIVIYKRAIREMGS